MCFFCFFYTFYFFASRIKDVYVMDAEIVYTSVLNGKAPINVFVCGSTGVGKTELVTKLIYNGDIQVDDKK